MEWFQHDTSERNDPKIIALRAKYPQGQGYEVYAVAREMIAARIQKRRADCQLEEDALIIHHVTHTPIDRIEAILRFCAQIGLLGVDPATSRYTCHKILYRLDNETRRSSFIKEILDTWRRTGWDHEDQAPRGTHVGPTCRERDVIDRQIDAFQPVAHTLPNLQETKAKERLKQQGLEIAHAHGEHGNEPVEGCMACALTTPKAATA